MPNMEHAEIASNEDPITDEQAPCNFQVHYNIII